MLKIAILDTNKQPLAPCHPAMARRLLSTGQAAVFRRFPFTLILKREVPNPTLPDLKLKIDPGSKTTGIAIINQATGDVVFAAEITHRGQAIKASLDSRRSLRRGRRSRHTRYLQPRFDNRTRPKGWLPPSLQSRISNVETWVNRLRRVYPVSGLAMELVRFDMQLIENPDIAGVGYQHGELWGYEIKELLLIKFGHKCCYARAGSPCNEFLEVEHINPRSKGGSNRISNLAIACQKHNQEKGSQTAAEYGFPGVQAQAKRPLKDAAAVNATRWALFNRLKETGLPIEIGSGGLTKFNRVNRGLDKSHWADAACVGQSTPATINAAGIKPLSAKAMGYGNRQMCRTDKFGFPKSHRTRNKTFLGFQTGDIATANVPSGKFAGNHIGRVTIRQRPSFIINGKDMHAKHLKRIHRSDGYQY
jgi:5-methylcytosine-specific restriction endonuclease McrA